MNRREMILRSSAAAVGFGLRGWLRVAAQEIPQTKPVPFESAPLVGAQVESVLWSTRKDYVHPASVGPLPACGRRTSTPIPR